MNKKILDVAVMSFFCMSLIAAANVEERPTESVQNQSQVYVATNIFTDIVSNGRLMYGKSTGVTAGVSRVLSEYSFTTESDEEKGISNKHVIWVTTPKGEESDWCVTKNDRERAIQANKNRWKISLTKDEIDLLARIVWLESCGEPQEGQEAVVEVIMNRMASEKYPDTLYDVLSQQNPVQFCSWKNRELAEPTEKEYQSIQNVLEGKTNILRNDTLYFSTEPLTPNLDKKIGGHSFCY